jgi:hypothetical protein
MSVYEMNSDFEQIIKSGKLPKNMDDIFYKYENQPGLLSRLEELHHVCWDVLSIPQWDDSSILSMSSTTLVYQALITKESTDKRRISNFPLVVLDEKWVHKAAQKSDLMISELSMQTTISMLLGVEWNTLSDVTGNKRSKKHLKQHYQLFLLLRNRIFMFIQNNDLDKSVLNIPDYVVKKKMGLWGKKITSHLEYDSDEEVRKKKRKTGDHSKFDIEMDVVNNNFLFDMDIILTTLYNHWESFLISTIPTIPNQKVSLSVFREWLFDSILKLDVNSTIKARRIWQEKLQMCDSYIRIHKRIQRRAVNVPDRLIIVTKYDNLVDIGKCSSINDIIWKQAKKRNLDESWTRISTDSMFVHFDEQNGGKVYNTVSNIIKRDRIRNVWIIKHDIWIPHRTMVSSFTEGFRYLRIVMGDNKMIDKVDISIYDEYF